MDILRTNLKKAKKLGSAKSGVHHWWQQRFTAIILSIFAIWLILFVKSVARQDLSGFITIMHKPQNIAAMAIIIVSSFYHATLGMQVIIEDYISCEMMRLVMIVLTKIFSIVTVVSSLTALFYMMIL